METGRLMRNLTEQRGVIPFDRFHVGTVVSRDSLLEQRGFELVVPPRPARGATTSECADALSAPSMSTGG